MKKLYGIAALATLLAGCREADISDGVMSDDVATKSVNIEIVTSAPTSRVAVDNSSENWALTWNEGDALKSLTIDSEGVASASEDSFTLSADDISADGTQAAIRGEVASSAAQMIMVYPAKSLSVQNHEFVITLPDNEVDMSAPYANIGDATVLVSDNIALEDGIGGYKAQMHHLTTILELGMKFEGLSDDYTYQIRRVAIGDGDLATKLCLNPEFSYGDVGFDNVEYNESREELDVVVKDCFIEDNESIVIPITSFKFWLEPEAVLPVTIYIEAKSKSGDYESFSIVKSEDIENTSGEVLYFHAGTYNSVKHTYDLSAEVAEADASWVSKAAPSFAGGDGSASSPYQIATAEQLARLAALSVNHEEQMSKSFILTDDIDLSAYAWSGVDGFSGILDGDNHTVSALNGAYSLLSTIIDATVKQLNIEGSIANTNMGGSVASVAVNSRIHDCSSSVAQVSDFIAGGIVGYASRGNVITNCYNTGNIESEVSGGIVGISDGKITISNCYNKGDLKSSIAGGIVGILNDTEKNSADDIMPQVANFSGLYNIGELTGSLCKGIYGMNQADIDITLKGCYSLTGGDGDDGNGDAMPDTMDKLKDNLCSASALYNRTADTAAGDVKAWSWELPSDGGYPVINYGSIWLSISAGFK